MKILIVEDEKNLGLTLTQYLQGKAFECQWASTAAEARSRFEIAPQMSFY
jgi:DNA-binding response OmpR family regulator